MATHEMFKLPGEHVFDGMVLPEKIPEEDIRRIPDLDLSGDVVVVSYPKTGTNWTKQLVWLMLNDVDADKARNSTIHERATFLELWSPGAQKPGIDIIRDQPHPRVIHSHLRSRSFARHLEENTKFVIVIRNPKDALVSLYHFYQTNPVLGIFPGSWDEFFHLARNNHLVYGDFFDWYLDWFRYKDRQNVCVIFYEDMKANLESVVRKLSTFLATPLPDDQIRKVVELSQFEKMKKTEDARATVLTSSFYRKGAIGDWNNYFSPEQSDYIDQRYSETLQKIGVQFRYK